MLLSSMDHLNYYSMPKESFLQLDTGLNDGGYDLQGDDQYLNEENSPKNGTKSSLYKTELCKRFSEFGNCRYGAKCQFAHGLGELRHVVRHPKYKTTKCKSYWGSGHCPYGSRCRFIHEEVEGYSTPQYSPQASSGMGGMGSMFMSNDKDHMGLGSLGVSAPSDNNSSFLYGSGAVDQVNQPLHPLGGSMPSYPKDYSLLSSFDKSGSWGAMGGSAVPARTATQSKLNYAGDHHHHLQQQSLHPLTHHQPSLHHHFGSAPTGGSSGGLMPLSSPTNHHHHHSNQNSNSNYPDLQDAIDALMKFSLTQDDEEDDVPPASSPRGPTSGSAASAANAPIGTISTSPVETSSPATGASSTGNAATTASTESDELWKDFPVASAQASVEKLDTTSWSSGLVLTLDTSKPFDVNEKKSGSGSEHSPRLSVFERFH